jgi:hypothetical protein
MTTSPATAGRIHEGYGTFFRAVCQSVCHTIRSAMEGIMRKFWALFVFETRRFGSKRKIAVLTAVLVILCLTVNSGIDNYKKIIHNSKEFQNIEAMMFKHIPNYAHYRVFGVKILFLPAASEIFFSPPKLCPELASRIDSVSTLDIFNDFKGKQLFQYKGSTFFQFSEVFKWVLSLFALWMGFDILHSREYLKFFISIWRGKGLFPVIISIRFLLLSLYIMLSILVTLSFAAIRGLNLTSTPEIFQAFSTFLIAIELLSLFFLTFGFIIGSLWSGTKGLVAIITAISIFGLVIPILLNSIVSQRADSILSQYKLAVEKWKVVNSFEKTSKEKYGKFDRSNLDIGRTVIEEFWRVHYKQIVKLEDSLRAEINSMIDFYRQLFILTPQTFYNMTTSELSSRGYGNFLAFYRYLQQMQANFVRFYIDRCFYNDPAEMVSFIRDSENLFRAKSLRPPNFYTGLLLNLLYILLLAAAASRSFRLYIRRGIDKNRQNGTIDCTTVFPAAGSFNVLNIKAPTFAHRVYLECLEKDTGEFLYLCHPDAIPGDIRVDHFLKAMAVLFQPGRHRCKNLLKAPELKHLKSKPFRQLEQREKGEVLLTAAGFSHRKTILADDTGSPMTTDYVVLLNRRFIALAANGSAVAFLTLNPVLADTRFESDEQYRVLKDWSAHVSHIEQLTSGGKQ